MSNWLGVAATKAAWNAKVETSSQRLMLLSIARYADDNGKAFPSVDSICADTCLSRNTAFKVLKELKNLGLIAVEKRQNNANQYTLSVDYSEGGSTKTGSTNIATTKTGTTKIGTTGSTNIATTVVPKLVHEENKEENKEKNSSCAPSSTESVTPADFTFIANDEYDAQGYLIQPEPVTEAVKQDKPKKEKKAATHAFSLMSLPEEWRSVADELCPGINVDKTFSSFRAYWTFGTGSNTRRGDNGWRQSWLNWLKNEAKRGYKSELPPVSTNAPVIDGEEFFNELRRKRLGR